MTEILGSLSHRVDSIQSRCPSENIDCGVMVTIKHQTTKRIDAPMLPCSERLMDALTTCTAILRSKRRRNPHDFLASTFSLARKDIGERSPCRITDAFRQFIILEHSFDVQVFDGDVVIRFEQLIAQFVKEITA